MRDPLAALRLPFLDRAGIARVTRGAAVTWSRRGLALALALVPALVLFAIVLANPGGAGESAVDKENVNALFARFLSASATVGTIAVSVASLTLGRELRGVGRQEEHHRHNELYRDRVRRSGGRRRVPMALGAFLASLQTILAETAARARGHADAETLALQEEGVTLGELLDELEKRGKQHAVVLEEARRPHDILLAALDAEPEVAHHLVRGLLRDGRIGGPLREDLDELRRLLRDVAIGTGYAKTLNFQWGLSRMSVLVLVTTLPALLASVGMVLLYPDVAGSDAAARAAAGAVVSTGLLLALLPVCAFVSYLLRFVFINSHTLPSADFFLGPEVREAMPPVGRERGSRS